MATAPVHVTVSGRTDVGRTRDHNEDTFLVADLSTGEVCDAPRPSPHEIGPRGSLFMVADGMGGAAAGELASALAAETIHAAPDGALDRRYRLEPRERFAFRVREAVEQANARSTPTPRSTPTSAAWGRR